MLIDETIYGSSPHSRRRVEVYSHRKRPSLFLRETLDATGPGDDRGRINPQLVSELFVSGEGDWKTWRFPATASFVLIKVAGGGGGGGGGFTAVTASAKGGGGGGGSGGMSRLVIPAALLPGTIYLKPGLGGAGSTGSGVAGGNATSSYVTILGGQTTQPYVILASGTLSARGGAAGGSVGNAAAGAAETVAAIATQVFRAAGLASLVAGQIGGTGGKPSTPTAGSSVTWGSAGVFCSGGAGGGAASSGNAVSNGGAITGAGLVHTFSGGTGVVGGPGNPGLNGSYIWQPFLSWGGSGGGACATGGTGGTGGQGGYASGGGGGGAGVTGGAGGNGGPGFVYLAWW